MRINKIPNIKFSSLSPFEKANFKMPNRNLAYSCANSILPSQDKNKSKFGLILSGIAFLGAASAGIFALMKSGKIKFNGVDAQRQDFDYIKTLAKDMSKTLGKKIEPKQLDCVVGKKEFFDILSKLSEQNYIASAENIAKGIFKADLHSHTWRSDGWGIVQNILDDAAKYGDELNQKTGEKFVFALTDHDGVLGVKEALELIVNNPQKYKNIKFVPGVELSFMNPCEKGSFKSFKNNGEQIEGSELLVHCINPYSKKLNAFIDNLQNSRGAMIKNAIKTLNSKIEDTEFSQSEMEEFYLKKPNENFAYNLHWRVLNYAQVKNRISQVAKQQGKDPHNLYIELMQGWRSDKNSRSLGNLNNFLESRGIPKETPRNNSLINDVCREYFPKIVDGDILVAHENTFAGLIETLSREENVSVGFAHPAFLTQCFNDANVAISNFVEKSKGLIQTSEKYHQGYLSVIKNGAISDSIVKDANDAAEKLNLLSLGGRDNHGARLFG